MSVARHHAEWLSLVEASGPFLSMPVLMRVFPHGLERRNTAKASCLREAYEDWVERGEKYPAVHYAWIRHVLTEFLEYPPEFLAEGQAIPPGMEAVIANHGETLRPTFVLKHRDAGEKPLLLIQHYDPKQDLERPVAGKTWKASPTTRMMELLHAADVPLGLITNGEQWTLVYAPRGETTGFASWDADLWMQEPITLRAFQSLLHLRRFLGVAEPETLARLYEQSAKDQQEVTEQLGYQVRRAVEMLVQAFGTIEADVEGRALLAGVSEKDLYNSALTVMMRLVFLFCAEERKLLLLGEPLYDQHYAVSTLSEILREGADQHGEEVLERRHDAWCRLLATFRAVHSGVDHEAMRLPPYGGTLFDPDAYPFLEGRLASTHWSTTAAKPLPLNNRVVLHLLEALQFLRVKVPGGGPAEARRLSFRALDIEQIGHVYEGLLDHTVKRATEVILGLAGSKKHEPEIPLSKLEELAAKDRTAFIKFLKEETGRSERALGKDLERLELVEDHALFIACGQDPLLAERVRPFAALIREDDFGQLLIITTGSVYVTAGSDRRSTGTHYTPRSLTEPIVQHTLEPLVYIGPAEGKSPTEWRLKSPSEILALKVCDMTMGSGAFLVQACRYLAERLVEAWEMAEKEHPGKFIATPEGDFSNGDPKERIIPADPAERIAIARRYVADRCLYGVDINPMAVEMAKLSLWLITLQRDRPFTFLDHALKSGDSLLGVSTLSQIENFSLRPGERQVTFATANLFRYVEEASDKRRALEELPSNDYTQIETKNQLHAEAEAATAKVKALADSLIAFELRGLGGETYENQRTDEAEKVQLLMQRDADAGLETTDPKSELACETRKSLGERRPFHWPVEFPEVFACGGLNAFVGNPPFMGGHDISGELGSDYRLWLSSIIYRGKAGLADLCAFFTLRASRLLREGGSAGFVATNTISEGDTRKVGLERIVEEGCSIIHGTPNISWPGVAAVIISPFVLWRGSWPGECLNPSLQHGIQSKINALTSNERICFVGSYLLGDGFVLSEEEASALIAECATCSDIVRPYINGVEFNSFPDTRPRRWAICFWDWSLDHASRFNLAFDRVQQTVKGIRDGVGRDRNRVNWWLHAENRPGLYHAVGMGRLFEKHPADWSASQPQLRRVIAKTKTSETWAFGFLPAGMLFDQTVTVVAREEASMLCIAQSAFLEIWTRESGAGTKFKTDQRFSPTMFESFPLPEGRSGLDELGERFHEARRNIMLERRKGLTDLYHDFHDRHEQSKDIARLRTLQVEMDQAVAAAYGWSDLDLGHGFHATKQGERYTISEAARREVLDRLLQLNHDRYEEEVKAGLHLKSAKRKSRTPRKSKDGPQLTQQPELPIVAGDSFEQ